MELGITVSCATLQTMIASGCGSSNRRLAQSVIPCRFAVSINLKQQNNNMHPAIVDGLEHITTVSQTICRSRRLYRSNEPLEQLPISPRKQRTDTDFVATSSSTLVKMSADRDTTWRAGFRKFGVIEVEVDKIEVETNVPHDHYQSAI